MKTGPLDAKSGIDRFATMDEIQTALTISPDVFIPCVNDSLWEVPSDRGGYVLISDEIEDASIFNLIQTLDTTSN